MKFSNLTKAFALAGITLLAACTAEKAVDNTVDASLWATKTAVKGAVGAGKAVARGTGAAVRSVTEAE